jgi:type VI secretion system protein ImpL
LRLTIVQLDGYQQNGPPLSYRFGLYQGDKLAARARQIYFDRFRPMLLNPTQANLVSYLRGLPNAPAPGADYTAAYNPLKAYLITTSNPDKSVPQFLTPVFLQYWAQSRVVDPAQAQLARQQIDFYAGELLRQNPYTISPDTAAVGHARTYLSNFGAVPRIYQDMLTEAEKASPGIDFNRQYPNSAASVVEPHFVPGAFTRSGFAFMQDAIQHPDRYFQGETWVLGDQAARSLDTASVSKQLAAMYSGDFIKEWHAFLTEARVVRLWIYSRSSRQAERARRTGVADTGVFLHRLRQHRRRRPADQGHLPAGAGVGRSQRDRPLHWAGQHQLCECAACLSPAP